jgi:rhamnopyranosyl-N-acetylglucosaminyl-diphospho-decaprenol beta-1,3/1,4-galactofuranosyltransferase
MSVGDDRQLLADGSPESPGPPQASGSPGTQRLPAAENPTRVVAVIVTYNRRELLLEALAAVRAQQRSPDAVIVVDNASTDGSAAAVRARFRTVRLVELDANYGGAGGFAYGMAQALADDADLIWLMDDDTIPEPGALAALLAARQAYTGRAPAIVASAVLWTDGRPHPMNTPRAKPMAAAAERTAAAACGCVPIRSASFVSVLVDAAECRRRGLPRADFFLWNDDFEFTTRLLRGNIGLLCHDSVVLHKTRTFGSTDVDPGDRFFYEVRNKIWTLRATSLGPAERILYTGATLRRWVRTYAAASDRRGLRACLRRGFVAGVRTRPRPNEQVLPGLGPDLAAPRAAR